MSDKLSQNEAIMRLKNKMLSQSLDCPMSYTVYKFQPEVGSFSACCDAKEYRFDKDIFDQLQDQYFVHHPRLIDRKVSLQNNIRHSDCSQCWEKEDEGMLSMRQGLGTENGLFGGRFNPTDVYPQRFELWMNSTCNLGCFMCHNGNSNTLRKIWYDVPDHRGFTGNSYDSHFTSEYYTEYKSKFESHMLSFIVKSLESMEGDLTVAYLGGEPTLHSEMYDHVDMFIEAASKRKGGVPLIEIVTNGTSKDKLNERFYSMMEKYKAAGWATRLMLSQDGADQYADVRHGADFQQISRNFNKWIRPESVLDTIISFTVVSNLNLPYIDKMADYICSSVEENFDDVNTALSINFNALTNPKWMKLKYLPRKYAEEPFTRAIEKLKELEKKYPNRLSINSRMLENMYSVLPDEISQEDADYIFEKYKYVADRYKSVYNWDLFETFDHLKPFANEYGIEL